MGLRIRRDGRLLCAAHHDEEHGDCYLSDGDLYYLAVERRVLVTEPMPKHAEHGQWWWKGQQPEGAEIDPFYLEEGEWTGARVAEGSGLLSRPASDGRAGSNPAPSVSECLPDVERGVVPTVESNASVEVSLEAGVRLSRESTPPTAKTACPHGLCEGDCACPDCGGDGHDNWFDRSICPDPCGSMHTRCRNCGAALEGCPWDVVPPGDDSQEDVA